MVQYFLFLNVIFFGALGTRQYFLKSLLQFYLLNYLYFVKENIYVLSANYLSFVLLVQLVEYLDATNFYCRTIDVIFVAYNDQTLPCFIFDGSVIFDLVSISQPIYIYI